MSAPRRTPPLTRTANTSLVTPVFSAHPSLQVGHQSRTASVQLSPAMVRKHTAVQAKLERTDSIFAILNSLQECLHLCDVQEPRGIIPSQDWNSVTADCSCGTLGTVNLTLFYISRTSDPCCANLLRISFSRRPSCGASTAMNKARTPATSSFATYSWARERTGFGRAEKKLLDQAAVLQAFRPACRSSMGCTASSPERFSKHFAFVENSKA